MFRTLLLSRPTIVGAHRAMPGLLGVPAEETAAKQLLHTSSVLPSWGNVHRVPTRNRRAQRHVRQQWRAGRAAKILRPDLPDIEFQRRTAQGQTSPEEIREKMKEQGALPPKRDSERPMFLSATGEIVEPYLPQEGDGKAALLSKERATDAITGVAGKGKSFIAVRKIRSYESAFRPKLFSDTATQIYVDAHTALAAKDLDGLHKLATERAYPEMVHNVQDKTIRWQYLKALEPPTLVRARTVPVGTKTNLFAQLTMRMNTQQTLAVYDRFGRLIHGSEIVAKDVLEYVVFEKHIANLYGRWRIHGKIIPEWMPQRPASKLTYIERPEKPVEEVEKEVEAEDDEEDLAVETMKKGEAEMKAAEEAEETIYNRFGKILRGGKK